jgi:hypothetical protein
MSAFAALLRAADQLHASEVEWVEGPGGQEAELTMLSDHFAGHGGWPPYMGWCIERFS